MILRMLLLLLPAMAGLVFGINILRQKQPVHMGERIRRCLRALPFLIILSLLGGSICMAYQMAQAPYLAGFKMSYTYPEASKGLTPNNTTLDVSEIFSDEVLERAIESGALGDLTADELKSTLSINNVKQKERVSADTLYVSTEYMVSYQASERTAETDKDVLLKAVADCYYDYFVSRYGRKTDVLENDCSETENLDYLDINTYLYRQANAVIEYMEMCSAENSTFVSDVTKESFGSVKDKATNFRDVSLERNKAYILKYGISRDREQYISRLNYENRLENVEYMKNLAAYRVRLDAIERYEGDITRAVLVPTRDESGEFYQSRTQIGTDYFAEEANAHLRYATDNQLKIETNNYYIQSLSEGDQEASRRQRADEMAGSLRSELLSISRQAVETVRDYDEQKSNGYISFVMQDEGSYIRSGVKKSVYYAALVFGAGAAAVFSGGRAEPDRKKKKRGRGK